MMRRRRCAAQALVECALVLPVVLTLTLGLLQVVLYVHARDVLISAVHEGARLAAEDGRDLADGYQRARALVSAGLGSAVTPVRVEAVLDEDVVIMRADASLRPILPLPMIGELPLHAEGHVSRERFRPSGGGR